MASLSGYKFDMVDGNLISATGCLNIWLLRFFFKLKMSMLKNMCKNIYISLRDNSSDPLSGDPDAVEWEKGFIEYAIENVSPTVNWSGP